jgi:hypothetical protein
VNGKLLVAGGDAAELLEAIDGSFHPIALAIGSPVEARVAWLVTAGGDHCTNTTLSQVGADGSIAEALVPSDTPRAEAWPTWARPLDLATLHQRRDKPRFVSLAATDDHDHGSATTLDPQVELGAEATPRAAERFVRRVPPFAPAAC